MEYLGNLGKRSVSSQQTEENSRREVSVKEGTQNPKARFLPQRRKTNGKSSRKRMGKCNVRNSQKVIEGVREKPSKKTARPKFGRSGSTNGKSPVVEPFAKKTKGKRHAL